MWYCERAGRGVRPQIPALNITKGKFAMSNKSILPAIFEGKPVRHILRGFDPWFAAIDVCAILGIQNSRKAVSVLDPDERDDVSLSDVIGRHQVMTVISEAGLYTLILRSRKAITPGTVEHRFRRWVTHEVIPQIRKFGAYREPSKYACYLTSSELTPDEKDEVIWCLLRWGAHKAKMIMEIIGQDRRTSEFRREHGIPDPPWLMRYKPIREDDDKIYHSDLAH